MPAGAAFGEAQPRWPQVASLAGGDAYVHPKKIVHPKIHLISRSQINIQTIENRKIDNFKR